VRKKYEHQLIKDPKRLRALSHPLRVRLLNLLGEEGSATATRCAEVLGDSVASCSYHLNILAKYGFIEEAPGGQGREKPWKTVGEGQSISPEGLDLDGQLAAEAAIGTFVDQEFALIKSRMARWGLLPESWHEAFGTNSTTAFLTAEEAAAIRDEIDDIFGRYKERRDKPELRPDGAHPVRLFLALTVSPERTRDVEE
jgi:DNA-binding transcriptional ArsR family regulator